MRRLIAIVAVLAALGPLVVSGDEPAAYAADVSDRAGGEHGLENVVAFYTVRSLLGSGESRIAFVVKSGAAEVTIPFARVRKVTCGEIRADRVSLTIRFRDDRELAATIARDVEVRGENGYGSYRLLFADVKELTFK